MQQEVSTAVPKMAIKAVTCFILVTEDFGESWGNVSAEQQFQDIGIHDLYIREIGNETTVYLATSEGAWIYRM